FIGYNAVGDAVWRGIAARSDSGHSQDTGPQVEDSTSHSPRRQAENLTFRSRAGTGARRRSEPLGSVLAANAPGNEVRPLIDEDTTMVARRIDESRPLLGVHIQRLQLREAAS